MGHGHLLRLTRLRVSFVEEFNFVFRQNKPTLRSGIIAQVKVSCCNSPVGLCRQCRGIRSVFRMYDPEGSGSKLIPSGTYHRIYTGHHHLKVFRCCRSCFIHQGDPIRTRLPVGKILSCTHVANGVIAVFRIELEIPSRLVICQGGCTDLNYIKVHFTSWADDHSAPTIGWVWNVSDTGTFVCPEGLDVSEEDPSHVPEGWTVERISGINSPVMDNRFDPNGVIHNVSGQRVDENYKGILIQNGKKYLRRH